MLKLLHLNEKNYLMVPVLAEYTYLPLNFVSHFHIHNVYHIVFILDGNGTIEMDNSILNLSPEDILIINPGEKHIFTTEGTSLYYFTLNFYLFPLLGDEKNIGNIIENALKSANTHAETERLEKLFNLKSVNKLLEYEHEYARSIKHDIAGFRGSTESCKAGDKSHYYTNKCLDFLTGIITKYFIMEGQKNSPEYCPDIIVKKIVSHIEDNIEKKYDLKLLSKLFGYNQSYLSGHFSKKTGMTISGYYNIKKLEKACLYLKNTKISITDVALRLGFSSSQHFSTAFKAYKKATPRDYRNNIELY